MFSDSESLIFTLTKFEPFTDSPISPHTSGNVGLPFCPRGRFSEGHNLWSVSKAARSFINSQFAACSGEEEFLEVPHALLMELVRSEALEIDSEYQVR